MDTIVHPWQHPYYLCCLLITNIGLWVTEIIILIYSGISIKRTPPPDGKYDEERIDLLCGQTFLDYIPNKVDISIKWTLLFAPMVSAL